MIRFLLPLALLLVLIAGCARVANPEGWAPPTEAGDTIYVSLDRGEISALSSDDYAEAWKFPAGDEFACGNEKEAERELDGIYGGPAIGNELIYIGAYDNFVYAVAREDGICAWRFETGDPIVGSPVLAGDKLYVPSTDGNLYLLDPETGDEIGRVAVGDVWSTPLLTEDGDLYVSTMDGDLWKFTTDPLEPVWTDVFSANAGLLTTPVLAGDAVVVGGIGEIIYARRADTGDEMWSFSGGNWFWGDIAVGDSAIYATSLDGKVYAVSAETGDELWSFDTESPIRAGAVIRGDDVIVANNSGDVYALNAETGDIVWGPTELDETVYAQPVLQGDDVLIVTRSGDIIAIGVDGRPTTVVRS